MGNTTNNELKNYDPREEINTSADKLILIPNLDYIIRWKIYGLSIQI